MEKDIIQVQSATRSNYDGYVVLSQYDPYGKGETENKVFLGKSGNYDNKGHYDNSDNSLVFISDNLKMDSFLSAGEGWTESQQAMIENGAFTAEDYTEYARLKETILHNFTENHPKKFNIDIDKQERGEESGVPFRYPNWEQKQRLFVDMDGTLTVFTPQAGIEPLYEEGYFLNLPPHDNVVDAVRHIVTNRPEIEVYILSAYLTDSRYAFTEKNAWVDKYLPEIDAEHRIFVPNGSDKKEWIGGLRHDDFLLDDYTKNLLRWSPGRGIKLLNAINHTHGTWQYDSIRYDREPVNLANGILAVMQGQEHIYDKRAEYEIDGKMTVEKMRAIIEEHCHFDELSKDVGITEFYGDNVTIGVSFESKGENGEELDRYIYNLFYEGEYINISGYGTKEEPIPNEVLNELVQEWNNVFDKNIEKEITMDNRERQFIENIAKFDYIRGEDNRSGIFAAFEPFCGSNEPTAREVYQAELDRITREYKGEIDRFVQRDGNRLIVLSSEHIGERYVPHDITYSQPLSQEQLERYKETPDRFLEETYGRLGNAAPQPSNFYGHIPSIGDAFVIMTPDGVYSHYIDSFGFVQEMDADTVMTGVQQRAAALGVTVREEYDLLDNLKQYARELGNEEFYDLVDTETMGRMDALRDEYLVSFNLASIRAVEEREQDKLQVIHDWEETTETNDYITYKTRDNYYAFDAAAVQAAMPDMRLAANGEYITDDNRIIAGERLSAEVNRRFERAAEEISHNNPFVYRFHASPRPLGDNGRYDFFVQKYERREGEAGIVPGDIVYIGNADMAAGIAQHLNAGSEYGIWLTENADLRRELNRPPLAGDEALKASVESDNDRMRTEISQREETEHATIRFYVAESMEFPTLGEYREGLTLQEAFDIYEKIPAERLNGGKGIGFELHDGSIYDGMQYALMRGNVVEEELINLVEHYKNNPLVQQAIRDCKDEIEQRYGRGNTMDEREQRLYASAVAHFSKEYEVNIENDYVRNHAEELIYCYQNGKDLIDFDHWTRYQELLNDKISFSEYAAIDGAFEHDILDISEEDSETIGRIQEELRKEREGMADTHREDVIDPIPNRYYYPDLDLNGTADELFTQARNGYIESPEALAQLQEILSNPVEQKTEQAFYVGVLKDIAEDKGEQPYVFAQMKKDILDGVNPEEVTLRDGLTLEVRREDDNILIALTENSEERDATGATTVSMERFLNMSAQEFTETVNSAYAYNMIEEEREPEMELSLEEQLHNDVEYELLSRMVDYTEEDLDNGIAEYTARGGKGNYENIADFIENKRLSKDVEYELLSRGVDYTKEDLNNGVAEYTAANGKGKYTDIADFIVNKISSNAEQQEKQLHDDVVQELKNRGYEVSEETLSKGIEEYGEIAHYNAVEEIGSKESIATFIENKYLLDNPVGEKDGWFYNEPDGGAVLEVYFNPDSNAGGQFVEMSISYELIMEAAQQAENSNQFFDIINDRAYTELIDIDTENFKGALERYTNNAPNFISKEGFTARDWLVAVAKSGIERAAITSEQNNREQQLRGDVEYELLSRGFNVTKEILDTGMAEYAARGGKGNFEDVADFIENEILSDEKEPEMEIRIGDHECTKIDEWTNGNDTYVLGNSINDNDFYYAIVNNNSSNIFEYDGKPAREEVESDYVDLQAERDIDRHEAEYGADGSNVFPHLNDKLPVYDRETEILYDVLSALKINDVELNFDENGLVASDAWNNVWHGAEFYRFLVDEALVFENDGSVLGLNDELLADFKELTEHNGVEFKDNRTRITPIREFTDNNGHVLEGDQISIIMSQIPGHSDRSYVYEAVRDFEETNNIPDNERAIHDGAYEDKDILYMAYDRYVGMSHQNDESIQPYMERLQSLADSKPHTSLLPLIAEVYYAQQDGLSSEQIDFLLDSAEKERFAEETIRNMRHGFEAGLSQEQLSVIIGEDYFTQENLVAFMHGGGSIEDATALKGADIADYYIISPHLKDGTISRENAQAIIQTVNAIKDWNSKDWNNQRDANPGNAKSRFSTIDYEFFTEYLTDAAVKDNSITPEMISAVGKQFTEQRDTNSLKVFIDNNGGFQSFDPHREDVKTPERNNTVEEKEEKTVQEGISLPEEKKDPKELLNEQLQQGIKNVLNSEGFKNWLDTSSKMFYNNYSFNNAILVWLQKPDATHTMGYEQWKTYGRNVAQGAQGIKIFTPVIAYEKNAGDLWRMIKGNLQKQINDNSSAEQAVYRVGMSKLEITMNRNGLYGMRIGGNEQGIRSEKDMQNFIKHNVLGKVPMYFTVGTVFDAKDTVIPEYLWVKKGYTKDELVKDENGKPIKNRRGEYKIINTPERQARFTTSLDMSVPQQDPEKMAILYDSLKAVSERNGIHVYEKNREDDKTLKDGADGYFSRKVSEENPKGYIVMPTDLDPTNAVRVMLHEMSHSELHGDLERLAVKMGEDNIPRHMREIQAESVAYVVGKNFGIETDMSSFQYLAGYSKGFELQALSKSIEVIYNECKQLTNELKTELAVRGLNMDLSEREATVMDKESVQTLAKSYIGYAVEQDTRIADIEKEIPALVQQNDGKNDVLQVLVAQSVNVNRQKEDVALIKDGVKELENADTLDVQKNTIEKIEAAKERVEGYKREFSDLSVKFQDMSRNEQDLKDRFVADPVATIDSMKKEYPALEQLTAVQSQYLAKSEYVSRELSLLLKNDPQKFVEESCERASQIDKVASKNGMFVEVTFCEQWTDKPIVDKGAIMHPKVADSIVKQAETQIRGLRMESESKNEYFPYSKCALTIYQADKGKLEKAFKTRVDIGDGEQASLIDHLKQIPSANDIAADFEKATREKGAKDKILFNGTHGEDGKKKQTKEAPPSERAMTRKDWEQEIAKEAAKSKGGEKQQEQEQQKHKSSKKEKVK